MAKVHITMAQRARLLDLMRERIEQVSTEPMVCRYRAATDTDDVLAEVASAEFGRPIARHHIANMRLQVFGRFHETKAPAPARDDVESLMELCNGLERRVAAAEAFATSMAKRLETFEERAEDTINYGEKLRAALARIAELEKKTSSIVAFGGRAAG